MARTFHKLFVDKPLAMQNLPWPAFEVWCVLHAHPVEDDGTIAYLKESEKPADAVIRALGVPPRQRPRYHRDLAELVDQGFLIVGPDCVRLANWRERQTWRKGKVPPPQRETPRASNVTELHVVNGSSADTPPDEAWEWGEEGPPF